MIRQLAHILASVALATALLPLPCAMAQQPPAPAEPPDPVMIEIDQAWSGYDYALPRPWEFQRGPGFYLSLFKIILSWLLFALWVRTTDWVSQDALRLNLDYSLWNPIVFGVFVFGFILLWMIPSFWIGFPLLLIAYGAPLGTYIWQRNQKVEEHQKVLTPAHLRFVFSNLGSLVGVKVSAEKKLDYEKGAPVDFKGTSGGGRDGSANLLLARRSPGYVEAKELIANLVDRRGDAVMLEYAATGVAVKYQIDGVWHVQEKKERQPGDLILAVMKTLSGLDANERVKRQEGAFGADYKGIHYLGKLQSQGTETGERVLVSLKLTKTPVMSLDELGMRAKTQEQLKEVLGQQSGLVIFAGMPGGGLSNLFDSSLKACDRYMRDFAAVEDVNHREHEIENVIPVTYNSAKGETPMTQLPGIIRKYPNVIVVRNVLSDAETVKLLCEQTKEDRLTMGSIRAKDATEALLRVLMLKVPAKDFAQAVTGVVCARLIRKLCEKCKEAYAPPVELLAQLGIPAGKVEALYRPPSQPDPKKPCQSCQGIGYMGRTGLYELLVMSDPVRQVLATTPKLDLVRAAAKKSGMKSFQDEGLLLVIKGITSLTELQRVLKL